MSRLFKNFSFESYSFHHKFLKSFPERITNYEIEPFASLYKRIETFMQDPDQERGILICNPNPINTGSILAPIALRCGITFVTMSNLSASYRRDPEYILDVISNEQLAINEVAADQSDKDLLAHIVNYRFNNGLRTFFGSCREPGQMQNYCSPSIESKIANMTALKVISSEYERLLANYDKADFDIRIQET